MKVNIKIANTFRKKLMGLMLKKNINYGLLIPNCKSIHTFNMLEDIDVLLLDSNFMVLMINKNKFPTIPRIDESFATLKRSIFFPLLFFIIILFNFYK